MPANSFPALPAWIRRRNGDLAPFEAHYISQDIFAASEAMGQANAFLAREMTDSVVHFLVQETGDAIPTTTQLAELIVKVVRELGQPALAQAYAGLREQKRSAAEQGTKSRGPLECPESAAVPVQDGVRSLLRDYSLATVYSRDLAAAFRDGLLVLTDLERPAQLCAVVFENAEQEAFSEGRWWELLVRSRALAGSALICDSPERWWSSTNSNLLTRFFKVVDVENTLGPRAMILNLHGSLSGMRKTSDSPLFGQAPVEDSQTTEWEVAWVEGFLASENSTLRVDWHIRGDDVRSSQAHPALVKILNHPSSWNRVRWVFDRPRRIVGLAEGVERGQPGILGAVGLSLTRLATWSGVERDPEVFLAKLPILARMGVAVGVQRRQFLRRQPALAREFLVERSPWIVSPVGLDAAVRLLVGEAPFVRGAAFDLARTIANVLAATVQTAARQAHLEVALDGSPHQRANEAASEVWGFTIWDASRTPRQQLQIASALQAATSGGTAWILAEEAPRDMWQLLQWVWKETRITRLALEIIKSLKKN